MIRVQTVDFNPADELEQLRSVNNGKAGAMVSFTGLVRDLNEGDNITQLTLEHYPGMTEKALAKIETQANAQWELTATLIIHRVGPLQPNDNIVLVVAASMHRKQAFAACEFMIDTLKTSAPFWKKESLQNSDRWLAPG
ncbi:MAG: molybdenum cofactor biosynthesis protein MoaE [Gammaproteobacteria bacterium]|nr:molybdenum cofactor biosynthesis protein MoaE [Gammaproteobacteria bacterium]MDH3887352.1 molybdenum cofactor biosynthesis protein MoaE [Gammaproteobacteria bacterium]MDH3933919.1 molybdenum cofactor biosynthesis protein MoaE [Gammaproteobacteria bacterium]MDH3970867.1 molybdenum cofactor biosynthesis protein MoaE [Gammaproteobacteria bacterium]MDH3984930.1 molybdenum cofactor biosynthesis protein MoaE [Gammaproteobacteria bacterium]